MISFDRTAPPYGDWSATCEALRPHTQVRGRLAAMLAPPEPQLCTPRCA